MGAHMVMGRTDWDAIKVKAEHRADTEPAGGRPPHTRGWGDGQCQVPVAMEPWEDNIEMVT